MKKSKKEFLKPAKIAFIVLAVLVVLSVWTNIYIGSSSTLAKAGFPGTLSMLFDYSRYSGGAHEARFAGQLISNIVAYVFMFAGLLLFILSLALIKHDKGVKFKCAVISLCVFVPATIGLTGGIINFFGEGLSTLLKYGGSSIASMIGLIFAVFALDIVYLILAIICLIKGLGVAVKMKKGKYQDEDIVETKTLSPSERAALLEDIRKIVREELDSLDRVVIAKESQVYVALPQAVLNAVAPAPAPAPVVEQKPEPKVEKEPEEEKSKSAPRIPFAKKMVKADKDIQDKYNEIKNEILSYGAKSRVSIAGDTFRLHRKAYVKINLVGKTLKVYFALDPRAFEDSPIPVTDASDKVAYEEVPALLKVKSNLSVKRAKDLVRMVMEADGIAQEAEVGNHNWIKDLRADLRAKK